MIGTISFHAIPISVSNFNLLCYMSSFPVQENMDSKKTDVMPVN